MGEGILLFIQLRGEREIKYAHTLASDVIRVPLPCAHLPVGHAPSSARTSFQFGFRPSFWLFEAISRRAWPSIWLRTMKIEQVCPFRVRGRVEQANHITCQTRARRSRGIANWNFAGRLTDCCWLTVWSRGLLLLKESGMSSICSFRQRTRAYSVSTDPSGTVKIP